MRPTTRRLISTLVALHPTHLTCSRSPYLSKPMTHVRVNHQRRDLHTSTPLARIFDDFHNMIDRPDGAQIVLSNVSQEGVTLQSGLLIQQSFIIVDNSIFLWNVSPPKLSGDGFKWEGWDESCWKIFEVLKDRPEILIFGTGKTTCLIPPDFYQHLTKLGIQLQVEDSKNACSTYNILTEEGRKVAVALLPYQ